MQKNTNTVTRGILETIDVKRQKQILFDGNELLAVETVVWDSTLNRYVIKVYAAVHWIAQGIGLSKVQEKGQVRNLKSTPIYKGKLAKTNIEVDGKLHKGILLLEADFLTAWLGKLNGNVLFYGNSVPLRDKLLRYQQNAQKIIVSAFAQSSIYEAEFTDWHRENMMELRLVKEQSESALLALKTESSRIQNNAAPPTSYTPPVAQIQPEPEFMTQEEYMLKYSTDPEERKFYESKYYLEHPDECPSNIAKIVI
jgi:hypothetical protein